MNRECTFVLVMPDGVERGLVGDIIKRFEQKGFKLIAIKIIHAPRDTLKRHYSEVKDKSISADLVKYAGSGPVVPMVWEGDGIILTAKTIIGDSDPLKSAPGTIRGDYSLNRKRGVVYCSDSANVTQKEIDLWFNPMELLGSRITMEEYMYE